MNGDAIIYGLTISTWCGVIGLFAVSAGAFWLAAWIAKPMVPQRRRFRDARFIHDEHEQGSA